VHISSVFIYCFLIQVRRTVRSKVPKVRRKKINGVLLALCGAFCTLPVAIVIIWFIFYWTGFVKASEQETVSSKPDWKCLRFNHQVLSKQRKKKKQYLIENTAYNEWPPSSTIKMPEKDKLSCRIYVWFQAHIFQNKFNYYW